MPPPFSRTGHAGAARRGQPEPVTDAVVLAPVAPGGSERQATLHSLRHSSANELIRDGYDIRAVQELLGHKDLSATMIRTHVLNRGGRGVHSPAARLTAQSGPASGRRPPASRLVLTPAAA